jgi:hypothetical protein
MRAELFQLWDIQAGIVTRTVHALNAAPPLINQAKLVKYAADYAIPQF